MKPHGPRSNPPTGVSRVVETLRFSFYRYPGVSTPDLTVPRGDGP